MVEKILIKIKKKKKRVGLFATLRFKSIKHYPKQLQQN